MATEVFGDATRGGEWASAHLTIEGERIVAADAPGLARSLVGLTLLEAAAVDGEPLAVEALAAALGQVFRAAPEPGRVAVAMSGGVDSAVALLRAGAKALGVTFGCGRTRLPRRQRARLLLPGRRRRGAHHVPRPRAAPRHARPARGVQARDRRSVHGRVRGRGDAEPVHALQRCVPFRRAGRFRGAGWGGASCGLATMPGSSSATACGSSPAHATSRRTSRTCSPPSIRGSSTASAFRSASRRRRRPGRRPPRQGLSRRGEPRARRRVSSAGTTTAPFSDAAAFAARRARSWTRTAHDSARTRGTGASPPDSGAASRVSARRPLYVLRTDAATNTVVVGAQ